MASRSHYGPYKTENFSNLRYSDMKNFLSILTLFVNEAKGAEGTTKKDSFLCFLVFKNKKGVMLNLTLHLPRLLLRK